MRLLLLAFGFLLTLPIKAQTQVDERIICGFGNPDSPNSIPSITVCVGDEINWRLTSVKTSGFGNCGGWDIMNRDRIFCEEGGNRGCENVSQPSINVTYDGSFDVGNVVYETSSLGCPFSEYIPLSIRPTQSGIVLIEVQSITNNIDAGDIPTCGIIGPDRVIRNVRGAMNINVIPRPENPTLTAITPTVNPGEEILLEVSNCDSEVLLIGYVFEGCGDEKALIPQAFSFCPGGVFGLTAPNYTTELTYQVKLVGDCIDSIPTNEVTVTVLEEPVANACNDDPSIEEIDNLVANQETLFPSQQRSDYHVFESRTLLETNCSIEQVWNAYLSSNTFAQPQSYDMPTELLYYVALNSLNPQRTSDNLPLLPPTMECENYDIASFSAFAGKAALLLGTSVNLTKEELISSCPELSGVSLFSDPIKVVIDGNDLCLTRYTKPGHIFHPGKTTTCFEVDNCGDIYIVTRGKGATVCGDRSEIGNSIAGMNKFLGKKIFDSNHARFTCSN